MWYRWGKEDGNEKYSYNGLISLYCCFFHLCCLENTMCCGLCCRWKLDCFCHYYTPFWILSLKTVRNISGLHHNIRIRTGFNKLIFTRNNNFSLSSFIQLKLKIINQFHRITELINGKALHYSSHFPFQWRIICSNVFSNVLSNIALL